MAVKVEMRIATRAREIEQAMEAGFVDDGRHFAGAFKVVARLIAEQEARLERLEGHVALALIA